MLYIGRFRVLVWSRKVSVWNDQAYLVYLFDQMEELLQQQAGITGWDFWLQVLRSFGSFLVLQYHHMTSHFMFTGGRARD